MTGLNRAAKCKESLYCNVVGTAANKEIRVDLSPFDLIFPSGCEIRGLSSNSNRRVDQMSCGANEATRLCIDVA